MHSRRVLRFLAGFNLLLTFAVGFSVQTTTTTKSDAKQSTLSNRRDVLSSSILSTASMILTLSSTPSSAVAAADTPPAAKREPLESVLYRILRVKEATQQETRLIKSGQFKDVQRANVKLAVKFMIENYRLGDAFITASTYIDGSSAKRVEAGQVGQTAVQNLYTILEYFDSADVQNIKVGSSSMTGKEELVLKGLEATRKSIDDFLAYFPREQVDQVASQVAEENELNVKEFDSALGNLVNMPTKVTK